MAYAGRNVLYHEGHTVTVEVHAGAGGTVPLDGDAVELTGEAEQPQTPTAAPVATDGNGVGMLAEEPYDYDPDATYAEGDLVGLATLKLDGDVEWYETTDAYTPAVGDRVVFAAGGGVRAVDLAGGDTADMVLGVVFTTNAGDFGPGTKAAVYRFR